MHTRVAFFSARQYDRKFFKAAALSHRFEIEFFETALNANTAGIAKGFEVVCVFVNDDVSEPVVELLAENGVKLIALRCAGFNNVDLNACDKYGIKVVRVPEYSPYSVAEHTFGLILTLNRKIHKAFNRIREGNFALDGLTGFDLHEKAIGIVGCGKIGKCVAKIANGFGMKILLNDPNCDSELAKIGTYTDFENLLKHSDIVTLHCPLNSLTSYLLNEKSLSLMKPNAMLVNTSRGGLIDTAAVIARLKRNELWGLAIDVYEEESEIFFEDHSQEVLTDDVFARLLTFQNVLITGHQAFFTNEALTEIARVTLTSIEAFCNQRRLENQVPVPVST